MYLKENKKKIKLKMRMSEAILIHLNNMLTELRFNTQNQSGVLSFLT